MFGFTEQERRVVLFLMAIALAGLGVDFLAKRYTRVKAVISLNKDTGKVDINKADRKELISLPGIGEKLSQRIIAYRLQNSGFKAAEELKNVEGITEYRYQKLKNAIFVE